MEYKARCHCGRVRFSFRSSAIKTASRCNCSLCVRRGAVLSSGYIPAADFTPHTDPGDLGLYRWNEKVLSNYFCKLCWVFTYIGDGENDLLAPPFGVDADRARVPGVTRGVAQEIAQGAGQQLRFGQSPGLVGNINLNDGAGSGFTFHETPGQRGQAHRLQLQITGT